MSCDSIHESNRPCTIPGRHDMQHGYQEPNGQWVFWEEAVRHISTRREPTTAEINDIIEEIVIPVAAPFPANGTRLVRHTDPDTSRVAANAQRSLRITETRRRIRNHLRANPDGLTDEQIGEDLKEVATPSGLRTRRKELVDMGEVYDSGEKWPHSKTGYKMIVWKAT